MSALRSFWHMEVYSPLEKPKSGTLKNHSRKGLFRKASFPDEDSTYNTSTYKATPLHCPLPQHALASFTKTLTTFLICLLHSLPTDKLKKFTVLACYPFFIDSIWMKAS